jgi:hypothetical protein
MKHFAIFKEGRLVTSGNTVGFELDYFKNRADQLGGELRLSDTSFSVLPDLPSMLIAGHSWEWIQAKQQGKDAPPI